MNEMYQFIQIGLYLGIFGIVLLLLKNIARQLKLGAEEVIGKSEMMTRVAMRGFLILICIWVAYMVPKTTPKTSIDAPNVAERLRDQDEFKEQQPAKVVVPAQPTYEKQASDLQDKMKEMRERFDALPDDTAPAE